MSRESMYRHLAQGERDEYGKRIFRRGGSWLDRLKYWWYRKQLVRAGYFFFGRELAGNPIISVEHYIDNRVRLMGHKLTQVANYINSDDDDGRKMAADAYRSHIELSEEVRTMVRKLFRSKYVRYADIDVGREEL